MSAHPFSRLWLPFTANRHFYSHPMRLIDKADGMFYYTPQGDTIIDAVSGLWCVNAGHNQPAITQAITAAAARLDYAPAFQATHPAALTLADTIGKVLPAHLPHVFFAPSGSDAVESALKVALAYHTLKGETQRTTIIARNRDYHGTTLATTAISGIAANRQQLPLTHLMPTIDFLPDTHIPDKNAFARDLPAHGIERADALVELIDKHGDTIAAVILEPVAGSTGVLPPPQGYVQKIQAICREHGIVLILDEVITGFGRLGAPFACHAFDVQPDMITFAKALTNGTVPFAGVAVAGKIYDTFMGADMPAHQIEFPHGFTWSVHPLACAAAQATLEVYEGEGLFARAAAMSPRWQEAVHSLKGVRHIIDIRGVGLMSGIDLEPEEGAAGKKAFEVYRQCFESGVLIRTTGDTIALSPPFIIEDEHIDTIIATLRRVLTEL